MDINEIMTILLAAYGIVALIIFYFGSRYEKKYITPKIDNPNLTIDEMIDAENKEMTFTINICCIGFGWPIMIPLILIYLVIALIVEKFKQYKNEKQSNRKRSTRSR